MYIVEDDEFCLIKFPFRKVRSFAVGNVRCVPAVRRRGQVREPGSGDERDAALAGGRPVRREVPALLRLLQLQGPPQEVPPAPLLRR